MSHLKLSKNGSTTLVVDKRLFSRTAIKRAAATLAGRCHVALDLDGNGNVVATFSSRRDDPTSVHEVAGELGNLLIAELASRTLGEQTLAARDLLVARALDGALPRDRRPDGIDGGGGGHDR